MLVNAKIENNFVVSEFLKLINVDFMFSYHEADNEFFLMNDDAIGVFYHEDVYKLIESGRRVVVINDKRLYMNAYGIEEVELAEALKNMPRKPRKR